ncbi:MAG: beta-class carbonic anhydrase, partial [Solirubrobacteraceae bacterium]
MSSTDALVAANARHADSFQTPAAPAAPAIKVAVVACMDARLDVYRALGLKPGDAHVIRNAGGAVTDDVIRSLVISQRLLGTEEVVLIHHTRCGMLGFTDDELR